MTGIIFLGCGSIVRGRHAPEAASNPLCEIRGFYDRTASVAESLAALYGGRAFKTVEEAVAEPTATAAVVSAVNSLHAKHSIAALEAGLHVLCEKPMAASMQEGRAMLTSAREQGKTLMVGHNMRLEAPYIRARELISQGEIGKILSFRTVYGHRGPEYSGDTRNLNTWFFKKEPAVFGAMADIGIHKADTLRYLLDEEFCEVMAYTSTVDKRFASGEPIEVDDNAVCLIKTASGVLGTLSALWCCNAPADMSTVLYGSSGVLKIYDDPACPLVLLRQNGERTEIAMPPEPKEHGSGIMEMFLRSIEIGREPELSGENGLRSLEVALACMLSSELGRAVPLPLE